MHFLSNFIIVFGVWLSVFVIHIYWDLVHLKHIYIKYNGKHTSSI